MSFAANFITFLAVKKFEDMLAKLQLVKPCTFFGTQCTTTSFNDLI